MIALQYIGYTLNSVIIQMIQTLYNLYGIKALSRQLKARFISLSLFLSVFSDITQIKPMVKPIVTSNSRN
jgi:hypothetical protein